MAGTRQFTRQGPGLPAATRASHLGALRSSPHLPLRNGNNNNNYYLAGLGLRKRRTEPRQVCGTAPGPAGRAQQGFTVFFTSFCLGGGAGAPFFPAGPPDLGLPPEQPPLCRRGEGGPARSPPPPPPPAGRESSFLWCSLQKAPLLGQSLRWCHFLCHTNKPPCDPSSGFLPARALRSQTPAPVLIFDGLRAPPPPHPPFFPLFSPHSG